MRCLAVSKSGHRCKNPARFLNCRQHSLQLYSAAFALIAAAAAIATVYKDGYRPIAEALGFDAPWYVGQWDVDVEPTIKGLQQSLDAEGIGYLREAFGRTSASIGKDFGELRVRSAGFAKETASTSPLESRWREREELPSIRFSVRGPSSTRALLVSENLPKSQITGGQQGTIDAIERDDAAIYLVGTMVKWHRKGTPTEERLEQRFESVRIYLQRARPVEIAPRK
jgi:hypothetical protein